MFTIVCSVTIQLYRHLKSEMHKLTKDKTITHGKLYTVKHYFFMHLNFAIFERRTFAHIINLVFSQCATNCILAKFKILMYAKMFYRS